MLEYSILYTGALETWADSEVFLAIKFYCQIKSSLIKTATTETAFTPKHILACHFISWNKKPVRLFSPSSHPLLLDFSFAQKLQGLFQAKELLHVVRILCMQRQNGDLRICQLSGNSHPWRQGQEQKAKTDA